MAAEKDLDWAELRKRSLAPGGFGSSRAEIWPRLLHVHKPSKRKELKEYKEHKEPEAPHEEHRDEKQIQLDTDRSFVLYPVEGKERDKEKDRLQGELHELLVSIFRKRPQLRYFQGYHDIVTVLFLTLPPEMQLLCAEKLSLHRVRDSMGQGLEPVLGLLRVMNNLLRLADPAFADILEKTSPLPFYALSNLLTLFSHDMPTLPLIQHVFDYILSRPPVIIVYLATAIILSRKDEAERLEAEGEDGMVHSLLSGLPDIIDEDPNTAAEEGAHKVKVEDTPASIPNIKEEAEDTIVEPDASASGGEAVKQESHPTELIPPIPVENELDDPTIKSESQNGDGSREEFDLSPTTTLEGVDAADSTESISFHDEEPYAPASTPPPPSSPPLSPEQPEPTDPPSPPHPSPPLPHTRTHPQTTLTALLTHSDALFAQYPPTHASLSLSHIMGPQSVIFTWSEAARELPGDDTAEAMVAHPELVVYPFREEEEENDGEGKEHESDDGRKGGGGTGGGKSGRGGKGAKGWKGWKRRRRLRKAFPLLGTEGRTMVAGAVLVLGVAMAVYGVNTRGGQAGAVGRGAGEVGGGIGREWRKVGNWVGDAVVGAGERVLRF